MAPQQRFWLLGLAAATLALASGPAIAAPIVFSASGSNKASITPTVSSFQSALGPNNGNTPGPLGSGRREINWDGGGTATTLSATPFAGFQQIRGAFFTTPGTGFVQAPTSGLDTLFGSSFYATTFASFSDPRLFSPLGSVITDTTFFIPGSNGALPATVSAFGAVFSDVDVANVTSLQFFDPNGNSLGTFFVPSVAGDQTFSFLGVLFDAGERVARVRITSGNQVLSGTSTTDQVLMDDFIFAEPQQVIPEPASLALFGLGGAALALRGWLGRRKG